MLIMAALAFTVPRRWAFLPLILSGCYMTVGQRFFIMTLDFTLFRVILFSVWLRLWIRQELEPFPLNALDRAMLVWALITVLTGSLLMGYEGGFIHRLGVIYNALGLYFFFRFVIRDAGDYERLLVTLAIAVLPLAAVMVYEKITATNLFYVFGGVPETTIIRDDRLRCQGSFAHPILAGSFGAAMLPLAIGVWFRGGAFRLLAVAAALAAMVIVITSASSGPLITLVTVLIALSLWPLRRWMRLVRWALVAGLIMLELAMTSHIWYLPGRISNIIGGTGWHRAELMDSAIRHFRDWWLIGSTMTEDWITYGVSNQDGSADITNYYIFEGVSGGILRLALFVTVIAFAFQSVGLGRVKLDQQPRHPREAMYWCLGVSLFAHVVTFMSVYYFDQMVIFWNLTLALCATLRAATEAWPAEHESPVELDHPWNNQPALPGFEGMGSS